MIPLPIDAILPRLVQTLEAFPSLVLQASPGSGKTTRVPPALLETSFCKHGREVLVLEPRRLAAKFAAVRVAQERGEAVGETVGYQFRFEKVMGPRTRLKFLTEGMLLRRLIDDPTLRGVGAVVLDEFHERHLQGDVALSYLRQLQKSSRPDLRLVVMSATLETQTVCEFLECSSLEVEAPRFPIDTQYLSEPAEKLDAAVVRAARQSLETASGAGDILVFLPGIAEMRRCESALEALRSRHTFSTHLLHGELSREEQERALSPQAQRKIILSTNVAETSLTIEGVNTVIDSGLHRQAAYSWWSGIPSLRTRPTSRASAVQRAGRAGRTGPGRCLRLYTKADFEGRAPFDVPEIRRSDLAETLLELKALGIHDEKTFRWFETPSESNLDSARALLYRLGALASSTPGAALTPLGKHMAGFPASPRLSRLLLEGKKQELQAPAAALAALISEGALSGLDAVESVERSASLNQFPKRSYSQFLSAIGGQGSVPRSFDRQRLSRAVLMAFPDRVARRRDAARGKSGEQELVFSAGGSARVEDSALIRAHEFFVVLEVQETQFHGQLKSQLKVRSLCPIEPEWLFEVSPLGVEESETTVWDATKERALTASRLSYGELLLEESRTDAKDTEAASALLLKALGLDPQSFESLSLSDWVAKLAPVAGAETIESVLSRLQILSAQAKTAEKPLSVGEVLRRMFFGKTSLAQVRSTDWEEELVGTAARSAGIRGDTMLPHSVTLPGGRKVRIQYRLDREPWIESRLQDFFGMPRGPAIWNGRIPLTLHLLAPNHRALQVTTDLSGFWDRHYPAIRKELCRKYPRHSWPEDPLTAAPPAPRRK